MTAPARSHSVLIRAREGMSNPLVAPLVQGAVSARTIAGSNYETLFLHLLQDGDEVSEVEHGGLRNRGSDVHANVRQLVHVEFASLAQRVKQSLSQLVARRLAAPTITRHQSSVSAKGGGRCR